MNRSLDVARFTAAQRDLVYEPHWRVARSPVIYCHGGSADATQAAGVGLAGIPAILQAITSHLFSPVAPTLGTAHWGNPAALARVSDAADWATENRAATGPAVLIGVSMGATAALNYAADNPNDIACVIGIIPAVDLEALRVADPSGARAGIDTAYSVTYPDPLPEGSNPAERTSELDLPIQLWTASDDVTSTNADTFADATGATLIDVGALGHDNDAVDAVDIDVLLEFIETAIA